MYSLILMSAMVGGAETPSFHGRLVGGCYGCYGPVVVNYSSCYGSSCNGCWGNSCHGGFGFLGLRNLFWNHRANVLSRRSYGCWGSTCYGCTGSSCHGGVWGAATSMGCWGSSCTGCTGCHGCTGSVGGVSYYEGSVVVMPAVGTAKIEPEENISANLIVELPAKAKLYVDGNLIPGEAASRKFHTPALAKGKSYYYELKAELTVAGKPVVEERKVTIKAGETITEKFEKLVAANADNDVKVASH